LGLSTYDFPPSFDQDPGSPASFLNATDLFMDGLKARKGKAIIWHGGADPSPSRARNNSYYRPGTGHDPQASEYCRLFMIPGCLHCGGGPGATEVDWLSVIQDWVEHGNPPDKTHSSKHEQGKVVMTASGLPYPQYAIYKGSGDPGKR